MELTGSITNSTGILNVSFTANHDSAISTCVFSVRNTSLTLGDSVTIELGYDGSNTHIFTGYVKQIERKVPDGVYTITANDILIRAQDYFIAASNPDQPLSYQNISAEQLVINLLGLAGLTNVDYTPTSFVFGITNPFEINLVSVFDYMRTVSDLLTWSFWTDETNTIYFKNRKPYVMTGTSMQPGDIADTSIGTLSLSDLLDLNYTKSERSLRNRVVVYGSAGISAEATRDTTALPDGFYKTAVLAFPELVDSQGLAQTIADYNVDLLCRITESISMQIWGFPSLRARQVVTLPATYSNRLGINITGNWYIYGCDHQFGANGFVTNLDLRRMIIE